MRAGVPACGWARLPMRGVRLWGLPLWGLPFWGLPLWGLPQCGDSPPSGGAMPPALLGGELFCFQCAPVEPALASEIFLILFRFVSTPACR